MENSARSPGVGPVSPQIARKIATDAFLNGVFYDGVDLRHFARWTRSIPVEVALAWSSASPPASTGSPVATAATALGPSSTTSNRARRGVRPP
jgi:hypothetical protein